MKKKILKQTKGITLIALVITIIVLLILAAVSIATLTGDNGLLTKAIQGKEKNIEGEIKDEIGLAWNAIQTDGIVEGWDINKKAEELQKELQKKDSSATVTVDGNNLKVSYRGYEATINTEDGKIDVSTASITIDKFLISGTRVTPPEVDGFTHTGTDDVDKGYTIKDANNNEFVWIPVDKNQTIKIQVSSEEKIASIVLTNPVGEEKTVGNETGKEYTVDPSSFTKTYNGPYRLVVTTESGETAKKFLNVHSLYAIDTFSDFSVSDEYAIAQGYSDLQAMFNDFKTKGRTTATTLEELKFDFSYLSNYTEPSDTIDYAGKVAENGGFYVGKYEATYRVIDETEKAGSIKATNTRTSDSTALTNGMLWNSIDQTTALSTAKAFNTSLNSSLLTGAAWDRVLGWLYETGDKTGSEIAVDSTSWGNYNSSLANTGGTIKAVSNNIYDLAGNVWEWTTEAYITSSRVNRGGYYDDIGSGYPASYRYYSFPSDSDAGTGFRLALYL